MKNQDWGGNLRELRNVIRRSVLFAQDNVIRINNLPEFPKHIKNQKNEIVEMDRSERPLSKYNEKEQILEALKEAAKGDANKIFIPFEATNPLASLGAITEALKKENK